VPAQQCLQGQRQNERREQAGDHIVDHHAEAALHAAIQPADRPRLPHIEQTEQHEAGQQHPPAHLAVRQQRGNQQRTQCDPLADEFIPDQAAVVVHAERATGHSAGPYAEHETRQQNQRVER
jgi:hypothetical protein